MRSRVGTSGDHWSTHSHKRMSSVSSRKLFATRLCVCSLSFQGCGLKDILVLLQAT